MAAVRLGRVEGMGMGRDLGGEVGGGMVDLGRVVEGGEGVSFGRLLGGLGVVGWGWVLGDEGAEVNLRLMPVTMVTVLASVVVLGVSGELAAWGVLGLEGWVTVRGVGGLRELGERSLLTMDGGKPDMMGL